MKHRSIKKNLTLLMAFVIVLFIAIIFGFSSQRIVSSTAVSYHNIVELQKTFSDIILYEKLAFRSPSRHATLLAKYDILEKSCFDCHQEPDKTILNTRKNIFSELLMTHKQSEELFESIHIILSDLLADIHAIHAQHMSILKKSTAGNGKSITPKILKESKVIEHADRLQTDLTDIMHSFFELRVTGKPKNQYLEQQFFSLLDEFYLSVNDFKTNASTKKDNALIQKLKKNEPVFRGSFDELIDFAYQKDLLEKQLGENREDMLKMLSDKRITIDNRQQKTGNINNIVQFIMLLSTILLIGWIIMNGRLIINKTHRIVDETEHIQKDLQYKIDIDDNAFHEFRIVYEALNSMAEKINTQMRELQNHRDDLEIRVKERTQDLQKTNEQLQQEVKERKDAEMQVEMQKVELAKRNFELSAIYEVSSKISRTINMPELFDEILNAVLDLDVFDTVREGGIYLVEVNRMKLVTTLGKADSSTLMDSYVSIEECPFGDTVTTGDIIISKHRFDASGNFKGKIENDAVKNHIALPLRSKGEIIAVLYFRIKPDSADSYIDKIHILNVIANQIGIAIENARLYEETKYLALYDPLTRVANRRLMDITLDKMFSTSKRYKNQLSVIMADIDHFKKYNDTHGHHAGDKLLAEVVNLILGQIRNADIAARYGGEEFLIILPETDLKSATILAERIRKKVEENSPVTISQGVATFQQDMEKKENLVSKADEALYLAKQNGRNRVEQASDK